jgi:hypothetical protein
MMHIKYPVLNYSSLILVLLLFLVCCDEDTNDDRKIVPLFTTTQIGTPELNYTFLDADIDDSQESKITSRIEDHGFVWSMHSNNSFENGEVISLGEKKPNYAFGAFVKNLKGNTTYYVRAYIKMNNEVYYANEISFRTKPGTWKKLNDFPGEAMINATGFALNETGFIVGNNKQVWEYNPLLDTWTRKNDFALSKVYTYLPVKGATSFVVNETAYVYCYYLWKYDASNDAWEEVPNSSMNLGCDGVSSFVIDSIAYLGGGVGNLNKTLIRFDPATNQWGYINFGNKNPNRSYATGFAAKGIGYLVGGDMWNYEEDESVIAYNIQAQTTTYKRAFRNDRGFGADRQEMIRFLINNEAYVGMGYGEFPLMYGTDVGSQFDFYHYNTLNDSWEPQVYPADVDVDNRIKFLPRAAGAFFSIGNKGYMGLGEKRDYNFNTQILDRTPYKDFWEFTPN